MMKVGRFSFPYLPRCQLVIVPVDYDDNLGNDDNLWKWTRPNNVDMSH